MSDYEKTLKILLEVGSLSEGKARDVMNTLVLDGLIKSPEDKNGYTLVIEQSVAGYCSGPNIKAAMKGLRNIAVFLDAHTKLFYENVESKYNIHGDHRAYCPQYANGYPSQDPSDGEVVRVTVIGLTLFPEYGDSQELGYHDPRVQFLRDIADGNYSGDIQEFIDTNLPRVLSEAETQPAPPRRR